MIRLHLRNRKFESKLVRIKTNITFLYIIYFLFIKIKKYMIVSINHTNRNNFACFERWLNVFPNYVRYFKANNNFKIEIQHLLLMKLH